ncbi:MAG: radical SAM family heme chaperone HemW [Deltaproteobacteria bacterium]|nr:radical SAM family heme chaperone HemW [Deltaproteobacteria bacterium]
MGKLALYIHIPFCVSKCHYCDFNSIGLGRSAAPEGEYVAALGREIGRWAEALAPEVRGGFDTVFFGGGTPSLFAPESIGKLLREARRLGPLEPGAEVTLELNPKTAAPEKMCGFREAGCNRLSVGVQTLDEGLLADLARAHDATDALQALEWAFAAGFERVSGDLMYGLPRQTLGQLEDTLRRLEGFPLRHLSAYELIVEEGTPFYDRYLKGRLPLPETEEVLAMRERIAAFGCAKGMGAYEVSNYACAGHESRHNLHYWDYDSFVGLGAGAVSFLRLSELNGATLSRLGVEPSPGLYGLRLANPRGLSEYDAGAGLWTGVEVEPIARAAAFGEFMMMGLRKRRGIRFADFEQKFAAPFPAAFREALARAREWGWVALEAGGARFTEAGMLFSNEVLREFLGESLH